MIDRQDIDALLISALYGELTPADEARLQMHLESHPGDKTALADLTLARNAVRESRFLTVQLEPPQAVSALLLQEASRRAKPVAIHRENKSEGWFQRFVRSFAAHPAMAAAAMLVIVIGVAGTMYVRGSAQNAADRSTETFNASERAASPSLTPPNEPRSGDDATERLQRNAGSAFQAQLAESDAGVAAVVETPKDELAAKPEREKADRADAKAEAKESPKAADLKKSATPPTTRTYIQTETKPTPKPMDLDEKSKVSKGNAKVDGLVDNEAYRVNRKPGANTGNARPTPPAVVVVPRNDPAGPGQGQAPQAPKTVGRGNNSDDTRDGKADKDKADEETTWAREQHGKVGNAVKANNCKEAAQLAIALFNRAPAYYGGNVESDRALKQCMAYITAEREREVERTQRARAIQRRNADEAKRPAPPTKSPAPSNDSLNKQ